MQASAANAAGATICKIDAVLNVGFKPALEEWLAMQRLDLKFSCHRPWVCRGPIFMEV